MSHKHIMLVCLLAISIAYLSLNLNKSNALQSDSKPETNPTSVSPSVKATETTQDGAKNSNQQGTNLVPATALEKITLGAGCFWCVEAVFQEVEGVVSVKSGYCNGAIPNPTYEQVSSGRTGHVEVCQIVFDPAKVSLGKILHVFWRTHDPTSLNRQGADKGTQYRSGIYYHTDEQRKYAELYKKKLNDVGAFEKDVVTEIKPVENFSFAEDYHQNYFKNNPNGGYCRAVIQPKMDKFRAAFGDVLKK